DKLVTGVQTCALPIYGNNRGGAVQRPGRRQPFDQLTADEAAGHRRDIEPQPLLIHEGVAGAEFLSVLDENGAAYRARYRHAVGEIGRASCRERVLIAV